MARAATKTAPRVEEQAVVAQQEAGLPTFLAEQDLGALQGAGISSDAKDFLLPFLAIAQSNSPQLKRQQADKYIPGLEAGDIYNTATGRFWKGSEGIVVVPAFFQKAEVEWVTRKNGGGYVATHLPDADVVQQVKSDPTDPRLRLLPSGNQLVETKYHFVITDEGPAVIGLTSTGLQISRQWLTLMKNVKIGPEGAKKIAPSFAKQYLLKTVYRQNDSGDWFQFTVEDAGWVQSLDVFSEARAFYESAAATGVVLGRPPESAVAATDPEEDGDIPL
jgi:hypothetical protein